MKFLLHFFFVSVCALPRNDHEKTAEKRERPSLLHPCPRATNARVRAAGTSSTHDPTHESHPSSSCDRTHRTPTSTGTYSAC